MIMIKIILIIEKIKKIKIMIHHLNYAFLVWKIEIFIIIFVNHMFQLKIID
jgi:hypothetical protein